MAELPLQPLLPTHDHTEAPQGQETCPRPLPSFVTEPELALGAFAVACPVQKPG